MNARKVLEKALGGSKNIRFADLVALVEALGFSLSRTNGSHHIIQHPDIQDMINLQSVNGKAKPYQIRQVLDIFEGYGLTLEQAEGQTVDTETEEQP